MFDTARQMDSLRPKPAGSDRVIRLFVMMKFADAEIPIENALREIFEDDPYGFQILLARDRLLEAVCSTM